MTESTYADIIEDKVKEWHGKVDILREQSANAPAESRPELKARINNLQENIESATQQLFELDKKENKENTLETKNNILAIFESIDKDLTISEKKAPYML